MEKQNTTERVINFRKALRELFKTPNGNTVLEFLEESYVDIPAVGETPEITYYKLGQKEFVQGLVKDARSEDDLDNTIITTTGEYDE